MWNSCKDISRAPSELLEKLGQPISLSLSFCLNTTIVFFPPNGTTVAYMQQSPSNKCQFTGCEMDLSCQAQANSKKWSPLTENHLGCLALRHRGDDHVLQNLVFIGSLHISVYVYRSLETFLLSKNKRKNFFAHWTNLKTPLSKAFI